MRRASFLVLLALLFASCVQPRAWEDFQRLTPSGEYSFSFELADTLGGYDVSFYTALDRPSHAADTLVSFPLNIIWRSPSGKFFSETVYYPADSRKVLYRSGLVPSESGTWSLSVSIPSQPEGLRGLGLEVRRYE